MNSHQDKENYFFGSNLISTKPLKPRKHKSLQTKIHQKHLLNLFFGQALNSNQKIEHIISQEVDTPQFGLDRKKKLLIKPALKNGIPVRWRQEKKSSDFELKMHSIDVVTFRPLIQKSSKIPDVFFKAIQCNNKGSKEHSDLREKDGISFGEHKYLPELNLKKDKYKVFQFQKVDLKLNPQKTDKLTQIIPHRQRQQSNINLLRNKLRKML